MLKTPAASSWDKAKSQFIEMFGSLEDNLLGAPVVLLGSIASVKGGKRLPLGESYAVEKTKHPYVRVVDMQNHSVDVDALVYLSDSTAAKISRYTISCADVYISIAGTIGSVGFVPESCEGANLTENAAKIVLNNPHQVDKRYLTYYLSLPIGAQQIEAKTMHTTQPKLALYRIEEIKVLLPSIDAQREFAAFVESTDKSKFATAGSQIRTITISATIGIML